MNHSKMNYTDPVRKFLSSVAEARLEADRLSWRLKRLEAQATKVTSSLTGMPRGNGDHESLLVTLADMREQNAQAIVEAERQVQRVTDFVNKIENPASRIILKLRYCDCLEWETPTRRPHQRSVMSELRKAGLYYERTQLFVLHGRALNEARTLYKKEFENETSGDS